MGQFSTKWIGQSFLLLLFIFLLPLLAGAQVDQKNVLILNSYHKGFAWTDNIVSGIESVLKPVENNIDLSVEYMDTKNMGYGEDYKKLLYELYSFKYSNHKFDAIISSDDNAFNFLRDYRDTLFPGVPVVYCGVNNRKAPDIADSASFTGVLESTAHEQTFDLILNLHPKTKKIYLVIDTTPSGNYRWGVTSPSFSRYSNVEFIRLSDQHSIEEIESIVGGLDEEAGVVFFTLYRDKSGNYLSVREAATRITRASARPVYTTHLLELPYGVVGGKVLGGSYHGEFVAGLAMQVLNGKPVSTIPVVKKSPTQFVFNYDQLKKWNISLSTLPVDSIILNRPVSLYEQNKTLVLGVLVFIFTMILIVIGLLINVLRRKKVERTLRESEEKFKALAETSPLAIYASSGPEEKGEYINPTYTKLFGYTLEDVPTVNEWWSLAYPDENYRTSLKNEWQQKVEHAIATQSEIKPIETVVTCKDGTEKIISWGFNTIGKQNWTLGLDLTERRQAEAERQELEVQKRQKFKMEAIGTMAGGIAHNFNNNLSIILGNVELSQLKLNDPEVSELLQNAKIAIMRSRDLVSQIMTFSRKGGQSMAPLQLPLIIDETLKLLASTVPSTVQLKQAISPESHHVFVNADASQIQELLLNLYSNAVHAMDEKGDVDFILDVVELTEKDISDLDQHKPGRYARITIKDSGCGMTSEVLEKIFDPFFTTKEMHEGTGMGLSTVHGIIEQHNGLIMVKSIVGQGTTIELFFPVIEGSQISQPIPVKTDIPQGLEKILFIDDDEMLANLGELMLTKLGYQVKAVTESSKALTIFAADANYFDLVITDQTMPDLTGKELIQELLKIRPDLPTIICTGFSSKVDAESAGELGAKAFVMKPIDLQELAHTVRRVLDENENARC